MCRNSIYPKDLEGVKGYIKLDNYNTSILYRKWEDNQWSSETYEPNLDAQVQDDIKSLKESNELLKEQLSSKDDKISALTDEITLLSDTIAEFMSSMLEGDE